MPYVCAIRSMYSFTKWYDQVPPTFFYVSHRNHRQETLLSRPASAPHEYDGQLISVKTQPLTVVFKWGNHNTERHLAPPPSHTERNADYEREREGRGHGHEDLRRPLPGVEPSPEEVRREGHGVRGWRGRQVSRSATVRQARRGAEVLVRGRGREGGGQAPGAFPQGHGEGLQRVRGHLERRLGAQFRPGVSHPILPAGPEVLRPRAEEVRVRDRGSRVGDLRQPRVDPRQPAVVVVVGGSVARPHRLGQEGLEHCEEGVDRD